MNKLLKFKVSSLRTQTSPYKKDEKDDSSYETIYYILVNMKDLPEAIPLDVNPRVPKMSTNVAKRLAKAVAEPETDFYINNRGIVISAKSLIFNSIKSEVTIDIGDQDDENDRFAYGILDGGHTYTAIMESYANKIAYKDNENKAINISELLRLMYAFDVVKYPDDLAAPIQSYSGKAQVFKRYRDAYCTTFYKLLTKELPILVKLYDVIESEISVKYCEYKKNSGVARPQFGRVKGVEYIEKGTETEFLGGKTNYAVSSGYLYPIFGAFRALLIFGKK